MNVCESEKHSVEIFSDTFKNFEGIMFVQIIFIYYLYILRLKNWVHTKRVEQPETTN